MADGNPAPSTAKDVSHQANTQPGFSNQVRAGEACLQPRRSSSLLPAQRRRVSEPLPHTHRPGETHTRYTYRFSQREMSGGCSEAERSDVRRDLGFVSLRSNTNLNTERSECGHTRRRAPADPTALDNTRCHPRPDAPGDGGRCRSRHTRSRTLDSIDSQSNTYTENIRAMAGQMYGEPQNRNTHRAANTYVDSHTHNFAHNRALTRQHHLRLSGGL